ncbi:hypothetical protein LNO75_03890, partial [Mycoplasma sp. T363T]|uniref:hypothetical protein n=1 Tax=Mycoplasma bradburyae TaxID=2963128 RepID=UPI0023419A66
AEKPTKLTKPTDPNEGSGSTSTPSTDNGSSNTSDTTSNTNSNNGSTDSNSGTMVTTPTPEEEKMKLKTFSDSLRDNDFEIYNDQTKLERDETDVTSLTNNSFKLVETKKNQIPVMGWSLGVELVSGSVNSTQGTVQIKVKFTKEGNSIATEPSTIKLTGFSSLQKAVKAILFTDEM